MENGIDADGIIKRLEGLSPDTLKTMMTAALKEGGKVLQDNTRQIQKTKVRANAEMQKNVKLIVDKDYGEVIVSIAKYYLNRFFETGTDERYLKRTGAKDRERGYIPTRKTTLYRKKGKENQYQAGTYRGKIDGEKFKYFESARENTEPISDAILTSLQNALEKEWDK